MLQSGHFNNPPLAQSLHLMTPAVFPHFEHFVCPRKSPSPSCRKASSKNADQNLTHSASQSWKKFRYLEARSLRNITYCVCGISLPFGFNSWLICWRYRFFINSSVWSIGLRGRWSQGFRSGTDGLALCRRKQPILGLQGATLLIQLAYCDEERCIRQWQSTGLRGSRSRSGKVKSSRLSRTFSWKDIIRRIRPFWHGGVLKKERQERMKWNQGKNDIGPAQSTTNICQAVLLAPNRFWVSPLAFKSRTRRLSWFKGTKNKSICQPSILQGCGL